MRTTLKLGVLALAAGGAYYGFAQPSATQRFAHPADAAIKRLAVKSRVVNGTGMGSLTISGGNVNKDRVAVWVRRAGQMRSVKCLVTVVADSATESTATTDCAQPEAAGKPLAETAIKAMTLVVREHVAATVDTRAYDVDKVADEMIALVMVSRPAIVASIKPPGD